MGKGVGVGGKSRGGQGKGERGLGKANVMLFYQSFQPPNYTSHNVFHLVALSYDIPLCFGSRCSLRLNLVVWFYVTD